MKRKLSLWGLFLSLCFFSHLASSSALSVLQLNLEQLTALADRIFVGKCSSVVDSYDREGRPIQIVTYDVEEVLKGSPARRITFRQLRPNMEEVMRSDGSTATVQRVMHDLPSYQPGEEAVVFLSDEGPLGLTAPIGLQQGKFTIRQKSSETKTVVNGIGNRGLFLGWRRSPRFKSMEMTNAEKMMLSQPAGEMPFSSFTSLVKKLQQNQQ